MAAAQPAHNTADLGPDRASIIEQARALFADTDLEIDDTARIRDLDNEAEVQCWISIDDATAAIASTDSPAEANARRRSAARNLKANQGVTVADTARIANDGFVEGWARFSPGVGPVPVSSPVPPTRPSADHDPAAHYVLDCLIPSRNRAPGHKALVAITPAFAAEMKQARQALKSIPGAHSIILDAPGRVAWPLAEMADDGIRLIETATDLDTHTRVEVGLETVAFFTDSPFGSEGDRLSTNPEPVAMGE